MGYRAAVFVFVGVVVWVLVGFLGCVLLGLFFLGFSVVVGFGVGGLGLWGCLGFVVFLFCCVLVWVFFSVWFGGVCGVGYVS